MIPLIIFGVVIVILFYLVGFFNSLKTLQVQIQASVQEIGNQLKRQADLIPNLVDSVKGYMTHEKDIFTQLAQARKLIDSAIDSKDPATIDKAQALITKSLGAIRVIAESNPQIQASGLVSNLMNELRDTADKVMYARRTLIDLAADFNVRISTIPGIWIAPMMGFQPQKGMSTPVSGEFLEVSSADTQTPKVNLQ
ncbi:MAG TPA: LemA family protein [Patescibacteria group bacterium]